MIRKASAVWRGSLKEGNGTVSTGSGVLKDIPYSFKTRFEEKPGTNPEELVAAGHAGCFSMALSLELSKEGLTPEQIETESHLTFENIQTGWTVTRIHLETAASVPGASSAQLEKAAKSAKENCPISRLLNAKITMEARLV